ncbi:hypothetical protein [Paenibacillus silvisoli]|uniref:hypothetical protein n=1 Tax=Paenibacillus silvisoli TaxID=3110539 RepID=UPI0028055601|nr:hypothetical protein [Paenibacillus silvisoli]
MKRVVIGMKNGHPYVISKQGKVEVIIKQPQRRSLKKIMRTFIYRIKKAVGA